MIRNIRIHKDEENYGKYGSCQSCAKRDKHWACANRCNYWTRAKRDKYWAGGQPPSGIKPGLAPSGVNTGFAPSGVNTRFAPSGIISGPAPSGINAGFTGSAKGINSGFYSPLPAFGHLPPQAGEGIYSCNVRTWARAKRGKHWARGKPPSGINTEPAKRDKH